jgi:hypothetical protein
MGLGEQLRRADHRGPHESAEPLEEVTLIPYGSTKLRVAAFPLAK